MIATQACANRKKAQENMSPPSRSTGNWPVCLVDIEKVAGLERDIKAKIQAKEELVEFKPGCSLTRKELSFDKVIEASNDPKDKINANNESRVDMEVDDDNDYLNDIIKALDNAGAGIARPLSDRSGFDDESDLRRNFGVSGRFLDEDPENEIILETGMNMKIGLIPVIPSEYEGYLEVEYFDDDDLVEEPREPNNFRMYVQENLVTVFDDVAQLEKPTEQQKNHLRPLHVKAIIDGRPTNRVLIDDGAAVNLMPRAMFKRLGKNESDLIPTDVVVTDFSGKTSPSDGVVMLNIQVETVERMTLFVIVPAKSSYNLLLGRDWIHAVGAIQSTVHQKVILWIAQDQVEMVEAGDSACYAQQLHVDFKMYSQNVNPITATEGVIDKDALEARLLNQFGIKIMKEANVTRPNHDDES